MNVLRRAELEDCGNENKRGVGPDILDATQPQPSWNLRSAPGSKTGPLLGHSASVASELARLLHVV